ncbi:MAG: hypothetical protein CL867_03510 [Cytophagaceae bacterium]|nr:hypothetical protein [Cytophagaceae bacterium]
MKFLPKIIFAIACFLCSFKSVSQNQNISTSVDINITDHSVLASLVLEFQYDDPATIDMFIYDDKENLIIEKSWENIEKTFKKVDLSELSKGKYLIRFFQNETLLLEESITKI